MSKSYLIAALLSLGLTAWVVGGYFLKTPRTEAADVSRAAESVEPIIVSVRTQDAKSVPLYIIAQGQAEPNRTVTVRAETSGQVTEILAHEGSIVAADDVIARLELNHRKATLERAKARVREQQGAYEASQVLGKKGYQTQRQSDQTFSSLQTAKAELEEARIELDRTDIRAPFEGFVLSSPIELGAHVAIDGEVATIVDNDPLVVSVRITQQDISNVKVGRPASISFATGEQREGKVRYVAARADEDTRTFRVEIELPNPNGEIPSGLSAEAKLSIGSVLAHFVSPAALSLNDEGNLGVKTVDENNTVSFHAAKIVRSSAEGTWITGLPAHARIITIGHGFVHVGEQVQVAEDDSATDPRQKAASLLATPGMGVQTARQ